MLFSKIKRFGETFNSHDLIKILGLSLMVIDHIGQYLFPDNLWYRLLGRGAAPLFFFLIGYVNHLNMRPVLILYGMILSFAGCLIWDHLWVNILLNFIFCQLLLWMFPTASLSLKTKISFFLLLSVLHGLINPYIEYGTIGILWMYSAQFSAAKSQEAPYWISATALVYFLWENIFFGFYQAPKMSITFALLMIILVILLISYHLKNYHMIRIIKLPGLLLSRYSLEFYFYHLILLQGYALLLR